MVKQHAPASRGTMTVIELIECLTRLGCNEEEVVELIASWVIQGETPLVESARGHDEPPLYIPASS